MSLKILVRERETMMVGTSRRRYDFGPITEDDYELADILLDLEDIILQSDSQIQTSLNWSVKRKRSALVSKPPSPTRRRRSRPPPHPPKEEKTAEIKEAAESDSKIIREVKSKVEVTSPSTPLAFSPSESDDKSKHHSLDKKISKKKLQKKSELVTKVEDLTRLKEQLTKEVNNVRSYYEKLKAHNLALIVKRDEVKHLLNKENPHLEINTDLNLGMKVDQQQQYPVAATTAAAAFPHQQPPCFPNHGLQYYNPNSHILPFFQPNNRSGLGFFAKQAGPRVMGPDLNLLCAEESVGMAAETSRLFEVQGDSRFMAAEARKQRMIKINKKKNSTGDKKIIS